MTETERELAKTSIDQLHKVVLQLSSNCFELKKLCLTVLVAAVTVVATFTDRQLDGFAFIAGAGITAFFWFLDSQSYYYQEKIRARMKILAESIAEEQPTSALVDGVGMPLSEKRETRQERQRVLASMFNWSMVFYLLLALVIGALGFLYDQGYIDSYTRLGSQ